MRSFGRRLLHLVLVLVMATLFAQILTELVPGDPAITLVGESATPEQIAAVRADLGLDDNFAVRYVKWVGNALQGDLGRSLYTKEPVWTAVKDRLPVTVEITVLATILALAVALPVGVYAAARRDGLLDRASGSVASLFLSSPSFLTAPILGWLLAVKLEWVPLFGWSPLGDGLAENLKSAITPVLTVALVEMAVLSRLLRSDMVDVLDQDHVLAARAIGLPHRRVLFRYALRPASFSFVTVAAVTTGRMLGGTVIVEVFFSLPGVGKLINDAISRKDLTVVQGVVLFVGTIYVLINLALTGLYAWLDPRVRSTGRAN